MSGLFISAQDISFSQFNAVNLYYNPAFTGSFPGNYRVSSMYRNQWIGLKDRPLTQMAIAGDIKFSFGFDNPLKDFIGAGVYFNTDRSQVFDWNTNEMAIQLAYHKLLSKNKRSFVSGGFGFGVKQRSVNYDNLYFEDQFDGLDKYNGNTRELLPHNIHASPTLNFGFQYHSYLTRKTHLQIGLAVHKLFTKEYSFYNDFENPDYIGSRENQAFPQYYIYFEPDLSLQ
ncbi:MAG: PorP/SprF family type IX secretion system membrane protein [Saprospiraceae bacterium]|nr:PorP/SprF family type IX secretion system membrane protein [Saprospiraceae bacterium]